MNIVTTNAPKAIMRNGRAYVDSRQIAADFGKQHRTILRSIGNILSAGDIVPMHSFVQGSEKHARTGNQEHRHFLLDRDGFALLVMGFTGRTSLIWKLRYIEAFNAMERELSARKQVSNSDIEAINAIADSRALLRVASIALQSPQWHDEQAIKDIGLVVDMANNGLGLPENVLNEI